MYAGRVSLPPEQLTTRPSVALPVLFITGLMVASMGSSGASTAQHVGRNLYQVSTPAVVLDLAKVQANCSLMLNAVQRLGLKWRPHIRSHKVSKPPGRSTPGRR